MMTNNETYQGLYAHVPFCLRKCDYCDFYSIPVNNISLDRYVKCLAREGELKRDSRNLPVSTIYLGGGTPNLLSPADIAALLQSLQNTFQVETTAEITMEANPARHDINYFRAIKDSGINRLSLGVQSFNENELHILNRIHSSKDALQTVEALYRAGLTNFNIDLIYGIPGQTLSSWEKTLETAVSCHPAHISMYLLQLNPVTPMAGKIKQGELSLLDEDSEADMYYHALDFLRAAGYQHYEISNLARPGCQCRHNLIYWEARLYTGLGAGAVSFLSNRRIMNLANVKKYMERIESSNLPISELLEEMIPSDLPVDALILGLRLISGINCMDFQNRYGINIMEVYRQQIDNCIDAGLLKYENNVIALTEKGYFLSNQVLCQFLK